MDKTRIDDIVGHILSRNEVTLETAKELACAYIEQANELNSLKRRMGEVSSPLPKCPKHNAPYAFLGGHPKELVCIECQKERNENEH